MSAWKVLALVLAVPLCLGVAIFGGTLYLAARVSERAAEEAATRAKHVTNRWSERRLQLPADLDLLEKQLRREDSVGAHRTAAGIGEILTPLSKLSRKNLSPEMAEQIKRFHTLKAVLNAGGYRAQEAAARLGPEPQYCPAMGFKHVGLLGTRPPCAVELYLVRALHDPGSFSMDELCDVRPDKTSWVVECTFRARNAFGAMVHQAWRFRIRGSATGGLLSADKIG